MSEPIPSELDIFGLWIRLRDLEGDEHEEGEHDDDEMDGMYKNQIK